MPGGRLAIVLPSLLTAFYSTVRARCLLGRLHSSYAYMPRHEFVHAGDGGHPEPTVNTCCPLLMLCLRCSRAHKRAAAHDPVTLLRPTLRSPPL